MTIGLPEILSVIFFIITALFALTYFRGGSAPTSLPVDWDAIHDVQVQGLIADKQKTEAVQRYRELSGRGLKEANDAVAYLIDHPNAVIQKTSGSYYAAGDTSVSMAQILGAVHQGNKIEAIKLYRELTGLGLKEAKDAIEEMARDRSVQPSAATSTPAPPRDTSAALNDPQIRALVQQGKKIEAIKHYRQMTGLGLKEAKDAIDALERTTKL